ncbi:YwiC-like family protein [Sanguibacter sp. HDW7]|uniref:YwiC-like family protein n=1 Tax=Sanguibacter sp. HDW7 TaxID=2714931 RepID=UPI00140BC74A|nr:YwiC-like family protein [Sanguibacter sp. HDW7]QIK84778.1 YwiC-like family protein [Sanguibacter sp. HDW7]
MADVDTSRTAPPPVSPPRPRKKRRGPGWVPDEHGAWAMLVVPLVLGIVASGPAWVHLPLAILWVVGYLAFYATGLWLRSHLKKRWFPPVRAYTLACVLPALAVLALRPDLLAWTPLLVPLVALSLVLHHRRKDRGLLNDAVAVVSACLILPVAYDAGLESGDASAWPTVWVATALTAAYFLGTVPYVKTLIRERGSRTWYIGSVAFHLALVPLPWLLAATSSVAFGPGLLTVFYGILAVRAALVPLRGATPRQVGIGEIFASTALTVLVVVEVL